MKRICALLVTTMILANCTVLRTYASGISRDSVDASKPKIISVIFDDSGSMINEGGIFTTRWVDADYATKAMASMMNEGDELRLYVMGDYPLEPV